MELTPKQLLAKLEAAYKAGWEQGYSDGGEHDCRMFIPTANRAWRHFMWEHIAKVRGEDVAVRWYQARIDREGF